MNASVRDNNVKRVCRHRGVRIGGMPYICGGDDYCCEGCFLTAHNGGGQVWCK